MTDPVTDPACDDFHRAAMLADIAPGVPLGVALPDGTRVVLVRDGDEVYAAADRCSHRDFALSGGDVVAPCIIECPWHGAQFDVRTGHPIQGPATDDLTLYEVMVVGAEVMVGQKLKVKGRS
ncbi:MAG TPA: Rieske 2Fe-2S domain-containing protein [Gemmatimonas sp.]|nr:Rieske 2Fe-2S domain-containing protein [Gemmatimonas sp.]